jgi:opacity protein-like surface antigen
VRMNWKQAAFLLIGTVALTAAASAQTDLSFSGLGTMSSSTTGNGTKQGSPDEGGGMVGLRHVFSPLLGFEGNLAVNGSNQSLAPVAGACGTRCNNQPASIHATGIEFTVDYVASANFGKLRPFALVGLGFVYTTPGGSQIGLNSLSRGVYVGGGGADWSVAPHVGLRVQYRANFFKAPDVYRGFSPTGAFVNMQEPMAGVFFRF